MSTPLEAAEALGQRLRAVRRGAGLTARELAARMGWHETRVGKYERGKLKATDDVIRAYCEHAGAGDELEDLLASAHSVDAAYLESRRLLGRGHGYRQADLVKLTEETALMRVFQNVVVPGLLQTAEYARATLEYAVVRHRLTVGDVDGGVEKRLERQQFLYRGDRRFHILVGEQALWTTVGDEAVMAGQLDRLIAVSSLPRVTLGVIPARASLPMQVHNFVMFDDRLVTVETLSAELRITRPREVATHGQAFDLIAEQSVTGEKARALILDVLRRRSG